MPPRLSVGAVATPVASKILKKERIVQALARMNDRDTQKAAAEDLLSIVLNVDQEGLLIVLSCLCSTGSEHKVFARKECARAIGVVASEACPLREQALQQPHLGKMLGQLRKSLQDPDSGVREASVEALALLAQGLVQLDAGGPQGTLGNPVLKLIFDCLAEQRKELNAAACAALGMAAPHVGTLDASLSRELVRKLNSSSFQAPAALLAALARSDPATGEPVGLMKSGPAAFIPVMSALVGQPAPPAVGGVIGGVVGSGVAGMLSRPDWPVRLAAADMLRSTALLLGPLMELDGYWVRGDAKSITGRAIRALESCKFDKVRDVRDVARNALAVLEDLHEYGSAGGSAAGWPAHIAAKLYGRDPNPPVATSSFVIPTLADGPAHGPPVAGRKSPVRRSVVSPGRRPRSAHPQLRPANSPPPAQSPAPPERRSSPLLARGGSVSERFRAAHRDGDVVSVHVLGGIKSEPLPREEEAGGGARAGEAESVQSMPAGPSMQDETVSDVPPDGRKALRQPSKASDAAHAAERHFGLEPLPAGGLLGMGAPDELLRSLALEDDAAAVLDSLGPPTFWRHDLVAAEPPPAAELAAWAAQAALQAAEVPSTATAAVSSTASVLEPYPSPQQPVLPTAGADAAGPCVSVPVDEWLAAQQRLLSLEEQQRQLLEAFNSMSEQHKHTIAGLQAKVSSLETALEAANSLAAAPPQEQQLLQQQYQQEPERGAEAVEVPWALRTCRPRAPSTHAAASAPITASDGGSSGNNGGVPVPAALALAAGSTAFPEETEVRRAFREVLAGGRQGDMPLLRLLSRTGKPVWGELGSQLSAQLLAAFTANLQQGRADGPMLARMLPWLYRLADETEVVYEPPLDMRAPLVAALGLAQAQVTDPGLNERVKLLVDSLLVVWALPASALSSSSRPVPQQQRQQAPQQQRQPWSQGGTPQDLSHGYGAGAGFGTSQLQQQQLEDAAVARAATPPYYAAEVGADSDGGAYGSAPDSAGPPLPAESQSPGTDGSVGVSGITPRVVVVRSSQAGRSPSMNALMGQLSDLARDLAAMPSPSNRPLSRGQAQ